eukprot:gene26417-17516_t
MDPDADNRGAGGKAPRGALRRTQARQEPPRDGTPMPAVKSGGGFFSLLRSPLQAGYKSVVKALAPSPRGAENLKPGSSSEHEQEQLRQMPPPPPPASLSAAGPSMKTAPSSATAPESSTAAPTSNGVSKGVPTHLNFPDIAGPSALPSAPTPGTAPENHRPYLGLKYLLRTGPQGVNNPTTWQNHQANRPVLGEVKKRLQDTKQQFNTGRYNPPISATPSGALASLPKPPLSVRFALGEPQQLATTPPPSSQQRVRFAGTPMPRIIGLGGSTPGALKRGRDPNSPGASPTAITPLVGSGIKNLADHKRQRQRYTTQMQSKAVTSVAPRTPLPETGPSRSDASPRPGTPHPGAASTETARRILETLDSMAKASDGPSGTPPPPSPEGQPTAGSTPYRRSSLMPPPLDRLSPANAEPQSIRRFGLGAGSFTPMASPAPTANLFSGTRNEPHPFEGVSTQDASTPAAFAAPAPPGTFVFGASAAATTSFTVPKPSDSHPKASSTPEVPVPAFFMPTPPAAETAAAAPKPPTSAWRTATTPSEPPQAAEAAQKMFTFGGKGSKNEVAALVSSITASAPSAGFSVPKFSFGGSTGGTAPAAVQPVVATPTRESSIQDQVTQAASIPLPDDDDEPTPAPSPAAPPPATGGWGSALLNQAASGLAAASTAVAKEIAEKNTPAHAPAAANISFGAPAPTTKPIEPAPTSTAPSPGGWDMSFLQKSQAASAAASDAVAKEIEDKKVAGSAAAPAAPGGGWDMSFLQKSQAASQAASEAAAKEIEDKKVGGSTTPAPSSGGGWGAAFLNGNQSTLASASQAVAAEIESTKAGGGSGPSVAAASPAHLGFGSPFPFAKATPGSTPTADPSQANIAAAAADRAHPVSPFPTTVTLGAPVGAAPASSAPVVSGGFSFGVSQSAAFPSTAAPAASNGFVFGASKPSEPAQAIPQATPPVASASPVFSFGGVVTTPAPASAAATPISFGSAVPIGAPSPAPTTGGTAAPVFGSTPSSTFGGVSATPASSAAPTPGSFAFGTPGVATPSTAPFTFGGAPQQQPSPFLSFGGAPASSAPMFGSSPQPDPTPVHAFAFGASAPNPAAANPAHFGQPQPNPVALPLSSPYTFGAGAPPTPEPSLFGSASPSGFFGAPSPWSSAAGPGPAGGPSPFGGSGMMPTPPPAFGASAAPAYRATPTPVFGQQQQQQPVFGASGGFGFGAAPTPTPAFGAAPTPDMGGGGGGGFSMGTTGDTGGRRKLKVNPAITSSLHGHGSLSYMAAVFGFLFVLRFDHSTMIQLPSDCHCIMQTDISQ